ncbi:hypothetical protein BX600DRAFT_545986 [Xylariales sp. PMI_506]|nr:hypothetical protein BX600DRAFT_545986 [Xylariales sp. PMI_506]
MKGNTMPNYGAGIWKVSRFVPCWILQVVAAGILCYVAKIIISGKKDISFFSYNVDGQVNLSSTMGIVLLSFCVVTLVMSCIDAVLFRFRKLSPLIMLVISCTKTGMWAFYLAAVIKPAINGSLSLLELIPGIVLVVVNAFQMVLAVINLYKLKNGLLDRGDYMDLEGGEQHEQLEQHGRYDPHENYSQYEQYDQHRQHEHHREEIPMVAKWQKPMPGIQVGVQEKTADKAFEDYRAFTAAAMMGDQDRHLDNSMSVTQHEGQRNLSSSSHYEDEHNAPWRPVSAPESPGFSTALMQPPKAHRYPGDATTTTTTTSLERADLKLKEDHLTELEA